jgi:hypothetical protein
MFKKSIFIFIITITLLQEKDCFGMIQRFKHIYIKSKNFFYCKKKVDHNHEFLQIKLDFNNLNDFIYWKNYPNNNINSVTTLNLNLNNQKNNKIRHSAEIKVLILLGIVNPSYLCLGQNEINTLATNIKQFPNLTTLNLDLQWNNIGSEGIVAFAQALNQLPNLTNLNLNLQWNNIGPEGIRVLKLLYAQMKLRNPEIVFDCNIVDINKIKLLIDRVILTARQIKKTYEKSFNRKYFRREILWKIFQLNFGGDITKFIGEGKTFEEELKKLIENALRAELN